MQQFLGLALLALASVAGLSVEGRSITAAASDDASLSGVIPSPNQEFGDEMDLQRTSASSGASVRPTAAAVARGALLAEHSAEPSDESSIPIYVSPFARAERGSTTLAAPVGLLSPTQAVGPHFEHQESSHAPPNYAPRPTANDLKTSASYGHGHHHGHGYDHSGWLDMGAWTGGKGSFGWYADYPVGGKHHGYGRK